MFHEKKERFIKMPVFEGGQKALKQFISENLKYPPEALKEKIEGIVQVFYVINNKGDVTEAKVLSGLGYGCNEEALRLIKLLKYTIPKTHRLKASFNRKLNIHFRLTKHNETTKPLMNNSSNPLQINYNITPPDQSKSSETSKISYNIEIKLNK